MCAERVLPRGTKADLAARTVPIVGAAHDFIAQVAQGVAPHFIGVAIGHADSRMVQRVYGRIFEISGVPGRN